jgi:hypothetical protein
VTTLAAVKPGDQFLFVCQVTALDATTGIGLSLYGPGRDLAATATIGPDGAMAGQLAMTPDQISVNTITGYTPISAGDVLTRDGSGDTFVCRWAQISEDGSVLWSASPNHAVVYPAAGWTIIGHFGGITG